MQIQNKLTPKQNLIGLGVILLIAFLSWVYISTANVAAKDVYMPKSPVSQAKLEQFEKDTAVKRCQLIKDLAKDKLEDDMNGVVIKDIDRNDLAAKRDAICTF